MARQSLIIMLKNCTGKWAGWAGRCTMPWNVLGTPQKFNFRTREKWKFQPHNWVNKQSRVIELKIVFLRLILDGIFERRKNLIADFFKNSTFYNIIFFHYAVDFTWHDMARVWQWISVVQIVNFGWTIEKFWGSVVFYILRPSRHCAQALHKSSILSLDGPLSFTT